MGQRKKPTDIGNSVYIIQSALTLEEWKRREASAAPVHHVRPLEHIAGTWGDA